MKFSAKRHTRRFDKILARFFGTFGWSPNSSQSRPAIPFSTFGRRLLFRRFFSCPSRRFSNYHFFPQFFPQFFAIFSSFFQETQLWRQKILKVAKDYYPNFHFAISDEEEFQKELEEVGLGDSGQEINVLCFGKDNRRYPLNPEDFDEFSEEVLEDFMMKLSKGHVKAFIKSQPVPKDDKGFKQILIEIKSLRE